MQACDRKRFVVALNGLASIFKAELDEPSLSLWWQIMQDMEIEAFEAGIRRAAGECEFMPKPVEIRRRTGELSPENRALKAWAYIRTKLNPYESVNFGDPCIHAAIRALGGWEWLGDQTTEWLTKWGEKQFVTQYVAFWGSGVSDELGHYLMGNYESQNVLQNSGRNGFQIRGPKLLDPGLPPSRHAMPEERRALPEKKETEIIGAGPDFKDANFRDKDLRGRDFRQSYCRDTDFRGADCRGVDFRGASFRDVSFECANLDGANFDKTEWEGVNVLKNATIEGTGLERRSDYRRAGETPLLERLAPYVGSHIRTAETETTETGEHYGKAQKMIGDIAGSLGVE